MSSAAPNHEALEERMEGQLTRSQLRSLAIAYVREQEYNRALKQIARVSNGENLSVPGIDELLDSDIAKRILSIEAEKLLDNPLAEDFLKMYARNKQLEVEPLDLVARTGGEEFSVVLPGTSILGAYKAGERIRQSVESTPVIINGESVPVTVSVGAAGTEQLDYLHGAEALYNPTRVRDDLLLFADTALYFVKESGRNGVKVYDSSMELKG